MKIIPHLKPIVSLIANPENPVVQVEAETGTGKSIMIPGTLAIEKEYRVFVAVPRVTSALSLHAYASKIFPALSIGYGAEGNQRYSNTTQVVYATSGHIRRKMFSLIQTNSLAWCDVLIVDEMHTGSVDNTVIMSLWKYAKKRNMKVPKLVLLSATPTESPFNPVVYPIRIERPYPVEIVYHPDINSEPSDTDSVYNAIVKGIVDTPYSDGDILVFAHGARVIEDMLVVLHKILPNDRNIIIGAYAALSSDDIAKIYDKAPNDERKIILATNIAESSITLDGVGVVFDALFENRAYTSTTDGLRLSTTHISKDSARQRLGRTGRTRSGICHRMMSESNYTLLDDHTEPEVLRVPIHNVVMEFMNAGLDPVKVLGDEGDVTIGFILERKVHRSLQILGELGAISDGHVTDLGAFIPTVPLGVYNGAFLFEWLKSEYAAFPGLVVACLIDVHSNPGYFFIPKRERGENKISFIERISKFMELCVGPFIGKTQLETYLNLWRDFSVTMGAQHLPDIIQKGPQNRVQYTLLRDWMNTVGLNHKKWRELLVIIRQTYHTIKTSKLGNGSKNIGLFNPNNVHGKALVILQNVYRTKVLCKARGNTYTHITTGLRYVLDTRNPISTMESENNTVFIIALDSVEIRGTNFISFAIPFTFDPSVLPMIENTMYSRENADYSQSLLGQEPAHSHHHMTQIKVPYAHEVAASIGDAGENWDDDDGVNYKEV